jgi:N-acetylglucosamine-6-sulfatase
MLRRFGWVIGIVAVAILGCSSAAAKPPPNIIVIQTDDQDRSTLTRKVMPATVKLLRKHGTTFTDYVVSSPLCCPSRAELLTGQYAHNNGVTWNNPNPYGDLREKANTLPAWLRHAGDVTAHVGKFLNQYAKAVADPDEVPPGWDEWHTVLEPLGYYRYVLRENGHRVYHDSRRRDYLTRVLNRTAVRMIHRYVPRRRPLFMSVDQFAPHNGYWWTHNSVPCLAGMPIPAPEDTDRFQHTELPMPPSFNELDVSDKPSFVQARAQLTEDAVRRTTRRYRCRLASLRAVDRGLAQIVKALRSEREFANTAIIFTSDNGWLTGQHRIPGAKVDPYEEDLHVPFVIRLPKYMRPRHGVPRRLSSTVANVDVAPTILRLAGAKPCTHRGRCRILDGRSMLKAIRSDGRRWPEHRGILLELQKPTPHAEPFTPCDYEGIRTSHDVYIEYHSATQRTDDCVAQEEREHYALDADPLQLENLFPAPPGTDDAVTEADLAARLAALRDCAGIRHRDPKPASGHYCE